MITVILCLFPHSRGMCTIFQQLSMTLAVLLSLLAWEHSLLYLVCWENFFFVMNGYWILSNDFSISIEMIISFLYFILLFWWITLINVQMLNQQSIPGIIPIWSWWIMLFISHWILFSNISFWIFTSIFIRDVVGILYLLKNTQETDKGDHLEGGRRP